jgi:hypothetical protein
MTDENRKANYKLRHEVLANALIEVFKGDEPLVVTAGDKDKTEAELKALGCRFIGLDVFRLITKQDSKMKDKETGETNPFWGKPLYQKYGMVVRSNIIWLNAVHNKADKEGVEHTDWTPDKDRANKIESLMGSRVSCVKEKDGIKTYYLNYVCHQYTSDVVYYDGDGNVVDYDMINKFMKRPSKKSLEREARKHGLTVATDAKHPSQMKFSNITALRLEGREYIPVPNHGASVPVTV